MQNKIPKRNALEISLAALAFLLLLIPNRAASAFSQGDLVSGGSIWLETTLAVALVFVSAMAFSLQIARGYFIRILNKFTLRLGADIWWLAYILIRDALIFMSFIIGLLVFFPGTFLDYPIAVPFMPVSVVLFGLALVTKLYFDADDNRNAFRAVTVLVFAATVLWITGTIFVTETPMILSTLPPGVSSNGGIWYIMYSTFSSQNNLGLAMYSFQACFAVLGIIAVFGFAHPLLHSRLPKLKKAITSSTQSPVSPSAIPTARSAGAPEARGFKESKPRSDLTSDYLHYSNVASEISPKDRRVDYIA
ncbi:MAG: hypothetical protein PXY39_12505 [archaeon]|nr:hypothetical protein [archaeon]